MVVRMNGWMSTDGYKVVFSGVSKDATGTLRRNRDGGVALASRLAQIPSLGFDLNKTKGSGSRR